MTPQELRAALATLLEDLLGTHKTKEGTTFPACRVGGPPGDWTATGLEVIVEREPDQSNRPLQGGEHNLSETLTVHLTAHGSGSPAAAVRRIARRYPDASVTRVPANERLGILEARIIRIPK